MELDNIKDLWNEEKPTETPEISSIDAVAEVAARTAPAAARRCGGKAPPGAGAPDRIASSTRGAWPRRLLISFLRE